MSLGFYVFYVSFTTTTEYDMRFSSVRPMCSSWCFSLRQAFVGVYDLGAALASRSGISVLKGYLCPNRGVVVRLPVMIMVEAFLLKRGGRFGVYRMCVIFQTFFLSNPVNACKLAGGRERAISPPPQVAKV